MNLGGAEILIIAVIGIMVLGPDKLPSALRMFGKTMGEVKKYQDLAKGEISKAMDSAQISVEDNDSNAEQQQSDEGKAPELKPKKEAKKSKEIEEDTIGPILDDE